MIRSTRSGALVVIIIGQFLAALSHRILNVAAPTMTSALGTDLSGIVWVVNAYQIVVTGLLLIFGRVADSIGRGRTYLIGLIIFAAGSALSVFAVTLNQLLVFRIVQGFGGGMMTATGIAVVGESFPEHQRGKMLGISLAAYQTGAFVGPSLGGFLVQYFPWQSIFVANVVLALPAIFLGLRQFGIRGGRQATVIKIDYGGAFLMIMTLIALTYGLDAVSSPEASQTSVAALAIGGLLTLVFLGVERKAASPSLDLKMLRQPVYLFGVLSALLINIVSVFIHFLMPFYLEGVLHYPPSLVGLLLLATPLLSIAAGLSAGALLGRFQSTKVATIGALAVAAAMLAGFRLMQTSQWYDVALSLGLLGIGVGVFNPANSSTIMNSTPKDKFGIATATLQMIRNMGWTFGSPIASSAFLLSFHFFSGLTDREFQVLSEYPAFFVSSLHVTLLVGLLLSCLAIVFTSLRARNSNLPPSRL